MPQLWPNGSCGVFNKQEDLTGFDQLPESEFTERLLRRILPKLTDVAGPEAWIPVQVRFHASHCKITCPWKEQLITRGTGDRQ